MKRVKVFFMSVMLIVLMTVMTSKEVRADLTDTTLGQGITDVSVRDTSILEGIDPASFYDVLNATVLDLKFADGQSLELDRWQLSYKLEWDGGDNYEYVSRGYLSNPYYDYVIYLYNANGEQVFLDYDFFEVGEGYVLKFYRGYNQDNLIFEQEISIAEPAIFENVSNNTISFNTSNPNKFETVWYPIPAGTKLNTEYNISRVDFSEDEIQRNHVSLWKYENGQAKRINEGLQTQDQQTFSHTFSSLENVYLVIGEKDRSMNISGKVSMKEKNVLDHIELKPYTCSVWNQENYYMPVTVYYSDGTSAAYKDWLRTNNLQNANGDGQVVNVGGFEMTTPNGDQLCLGFKDNAGNWMEIGNSREWKAGTYTAVAYLLNDRSNCSESTITIEEPNAKALNLEGYQTADFKVSAEDVKYYKIVTKDKIDVLLVNNSDNTLYYCAYSRTPGSDEAWGRYYNVYEVDENDHISFKGGKEYLFILYSDKEATGTIGRYSSDSKVTKAAKVGDELDLSDVTVWNKLPVKLNFVSANNSSLQTGWQIINNWKVMTYSAEAYGFTVYGERIYYVLYKDGEPYEIPNENTLRQLKCGEYKINFYKENPDEKNLIGTTILKTNYVHEWEEINLISVATCSSIGEIEYRCSKCREKKIERTPKKSHSYSTEWTIDKKATTTADGSKSKHCTKCNEKKDVTKIKKASKVSLSTVTYTYNGKKKSPTVIVKDSAGKKIAKTNYTVTSPAGRKNVGKYTYTIKFKNQYSGTKKLTLKINPKSTSISKLTKAKKAFTVKWKKQSAKMSTSRITGYQIQYSTSKKFTSPKSTTVSGYSKTSKKITGLKSKKTYYVRVRTYKTVNGTKYYSGWSTVKSIKTK